jgi:hypothetical protein
MAEDWSTELGVSEKELAEAVGRIGARKAPGPNGIPARLWKGTAGELAPRLRRLFYRCLAWGEFPGLWKEGRMVLLPKPGRPPDSPSARDVVPTRRGGEGIREGGGGSDGGAHVSGAAQARGRTVRVPQGAVHDRRNRVLSLVEEAEQRGWVTLAVSLDIVNAFNSLPWERIGEDLEFHRVPPICREFPQGGPPVTACHRLRESLGYWRTHGPEVRGDCRAEPTYKKPKCLAGRTAGSAMTSVTR